MGKLNCSDWIQRRVLERRRRYDRSGGIRVGGAIPIAAHRLRLRTVNGWWLYVMLVAGAALSLLARFYEPFPGDIPLILWVRSLQHPVTTDFMRTASLIGGPFPLIALAIAAAALLLLTNRRRECCALVCAVALPVLAPILKVLVDRPRPPADLLGSSYGFRGLGFPSGHAFQSLVLFGFLFHLATVLISRKWLRWSVQAFLVFLILAIGVSRVYLGAHWPSDVLGAYLIAGACLVLLLRGFQSKAATAPAR